MEDSLSACKQGRLACVGLTIRFYDQPGGDASLPHDRFITTDQVALGIPRGMDFLDRKTGKNRDVSMDYKSKKQVAALMRNYESGAQPEIDL